VTCYLASDVHLRLDRPERGRRFARWVKQLDGGDTLLIVGDLCDFWMAARLRESELLQCEGLRALTDFRARGGTLEILPGNHDLWLCPFYERVLGAKLRDEPYDLTVHGLRLHLVHGHLLGARKPWKALMEGRPFFWAFGKIPSHAAHLFDHVLEWKNQRELEEDERRHIAVYRDYAARLHGLTDIVVTGHVHRALDDLGAIPRLVVLGGWQERSSYLMIDPTGASFHVASDDQVESRGTAAVSLSSPPSEQR
jgi:UDP-2,3-diacylglucosamine hydrolase